MPFRRLTGRVAAAVQRAFARPPAVGTPLSFAIPVLCYHSWAIDGGAYETDDHVALESDLNTLAMRGYRIIPLTALVDMLRGRAPFLVKHGDKFAGVSFDDGRDHDYCDLADDQGRSVPAMRTILKRAEPFLERICAGPMAVSFVIASPEGRKILDRTCGAGRDQWRDTWWEASAAEGVLGIANHGWDHVHDTLPVVRQRENRKGSFLAIDSFEDAEGQIADAQRYIAERTNDRALPLFAYPYGHVAGYLRDEYFPCNGARLGIHAAFGTGGASVRPDTPVWDIPRFVHGWHWSTREEFNGLLDAVERGER